MDHLRSIATAAVGVFTARLALPGVIVIGLASSVVLSSGSLGASAIATPRCTTAALSVLQNLSGSSVISVTVAGLPAGCGGATVQVTVNNGSATGSGSATVPGGGGSVTVTLGSSVAVAIADQVDLVVVGP